MFNRKTVEQLIIDDNESLDCLQKEAKDIESPNHLKAILQLELCQIYKPKNLPALLTDLKKYVRLRF